MYYKEEIINGILCFKHTPNGEWIEFSKENLTKMILRLKAEISTLRNEHDIREHGTTMYFE